MKIVDKELLDSVTEKAKNSPRLRMNYNFHVSDCLMRSSQEL